MSWTWATHKMARGRTPKYAPKKRDSKGRFRKATPSRSPARQPSRAKSAPARLASPKRKAAAPKTQGSQMGYKSSTLSLAKPMSRGAMTAALTKSMLESVILRWNGVKAFSGNGNYWMQNRVVTAGYRSLPWYMMDLTAVNNYPGADFTSFPMLQLGQVAATGNMVFQAISGLQADGVTASQTYQLEKAPSATIATTAPFGRSMLQSASISANLWGATSKATKYMVQIVRILDEDLVPLHRNPATGLGMTFAADVANATARRNDFYQNMIKSWTFNPIATTGGLQARKYKVLKTQTITIEPNPTTDGDADPQCVVYKAFLKLNKICNYEEGAIALATDVDTNDQADFAVNTGSHLMPQIEAKSRIYLVIRATNYGSDGASDSNTVTPSFDLSVRIRHTIPK